MNLCPQKLTLREAQATDCELLRSWDKQPHILATKGDDDWEWETELLRHPVWREQLIAEVDSRPIGFIQIIDPHLEESKYWGDVPASLRAIDIWIGEADYLGKGYGTLMMELAIDRCFAHKNVTAVLVDPMADNLHAHDFYQKLGFTLSERRRFGNDDCCIFTLERTHF